MRSMRTGSSSPSHSARCISASCRPRHSPGQGKPSEPTTSAKALLPGLVARLLTPRADGLIRTKPPPPPRRLWALNGPEPIASACAVERPLARVEPVRREKHLSDGQDPDNKVAW